jgi:hypothetical protein
MVEDTLRQELEASFRNRADLYRLMQAELVAELGLERGEALIIVPGGRCVRQGLVRSGGSGFCQPDMERAARWRVLPHPAA